MDMNFADLKKEAAATAADVFSPTAEAAKKATNDTYDLLGGSGCRASTSARDDNTHTEHYFENEQRGIDFEHVDPQSFVQLMSAGAKEAQVQLDAKFAQRNDFDDFFSNASKDLQSIGQPLQRDFKQNAHDFINAERGLFRTPGDIAAPIPATVPRVHNHPTESAGKEEDLLNFSDGDTTQRAQPFLEDVGNKFAPSAPAAPATTTNTFYDDDLGVGKSTHSASNKDSDTDSPSLSFNPSPAKKNPVIAALKELDNEKFISSEDLLGDFKEERTATPHFHTTGNTAKSETITLVQLPKTSVPVTDLDAEVEPGFPSSQVEEVKNYVLSKATTATGTKTADEAAIAAATKPAAVTEPAGSTLAKTSSISPKKDTTEAVKTRIALPVPTKENKLSHQHLDQPKIVSVEEIFYKYGLVESLIYWRDVKKSGIFFGAGLVTLLAISCFSVISVFAYLSLLTLAGTVSFRIYKSVMQAIQKTPEGHPFKEYLDIDLTLPQEKVQNIAGIAVAHVNGFVAELRRLFLVEDLIDSIKFGVILWVLTYIGGWFNGMTLVILAFVSLFTLPKVYENNKQSIDTYLDLARSKLTEFTEKFLATGDSFKTIAESFRLGYTTIQEIVHTTCAALWGILSKTVMPIPDESRWKSIEGDFSQKWNYPNCIGALDGKHVQIFAPPKTGSLYFNYKKFFL
ncbi:PREDICTED: reticulon-4 isoform X2 [Rhagoletis zephyria]|uniref:reticulon-4 isoform X2 n=1 Tax=Rhagoletis zephyria TaxID=28612 RepID=UPI0008117CFF|nr:PREDICTED: reticulon-4 isoform X2 [Rhagoletis zephyria]